jgi:SAM-dependent methyltransferase
MAARHDDLAPANTRSTITHMWKPDRLRRAIRTYVLERTLWRLPRDSSVLDLCCGHGFYFTINPHASGIDGDRQAIDELARDGYDVQVGNVLEGLPYPDGRFSWVIAHDVLEHFTFQQLERLVGEVHRVLAPEGRFLVIVPNRKGFDYGVAMNVGHELFITEREIRALASGQFALDQHYPEPLPRWVGRFFTHNKEVFWLRKAESVSS